MTDKDLNKIHDDIVSLLKAKLPKHLAYHSLKHTLYVLNRANYIAEKEGVSGNNLRLVKIAALCHDIGFTQTHINHEEIGCKIVRNHFKDYNLTSDEVKQICGMIMATKVPQQPKNLLEEILADADLEYLSTNKFKAIGNKLFLEQKHYNPNLTEQQWDTIQIAFLKKHKYFTKYCKHYKEHRKQRNLHSLLKTI